MTTFGPDGDDGEGPSGRDGPEGGQASRESEAVSTVEKAAMVVSITITLALFAFVSWHAVTGTDAGTPAASIASTNETDLGTVHEIRVRNPGDVGLVSATVVVRCGDPVREVTVTNVPADGWRSATVVCPTGADAPPVDVVQWIRQ